MQKSQNYALSIVFSFNTECQSMTFAVVRRFDPGEVVQQFADRVIHGKHSAWTHLFADYSAGGGYCYSYKHARFSAAKPRTVGRYPHAPDHQCNLSIITAVAALTARSIVPGFVVGASAASAAGSCTPAALRIRIAPRRRFARGGRLGIRTHCRFARRQSALLDFWLCYLFNLYCRGRR